MRIALIREGKNPPDKRVALSPKQAKEVMTKWPHVTLVAQTSNIRKFSDEAYRNAGVEVVNSVDDCDVLIGVKEVPIDMLIPGKTYLFFSHTFKMQPYNAPLLAALLEKKIRLIDYEVIKSPNGRRLIGFGRYAGVVGCYNGWRLFGIRNRLFTLKPAHECHNRAEMEAELQKVTIPKNTKVVLTGFGRVGHGAREIMALLPIREVSPEAFLDETFDAPVFTHLEVNHYNRRKEDGGFDKKAFYADATGYESTFPQYMHVADVYIACHYYAEGAPFLFTRSDAKSPHWRTTVIADVSCDIDGPIASTIRPSTIANPFYGYDRFLESECDLMHPNAIAVMAVDNLPCELPYDASEDFGSELMEHVLPLLIEGDRDHILANATETDLNGALTPAFEYLADYAAQGRKTLQVKTTEG